MSSRFIEDVLHMPECNLTNISATSGDIFNTEALTIRYGVVGIGITNPNYSNLEYMLQVKPNINVHENIYFGQGDNVSSIGVGENGGQNSIIYKSMLHDFKDLSNKTLLSMSEERAKIASRGLWLGNTVLFKENDSTIPNPLNTVSINGTVLSSMAINDYEGNNQLIRIENTNEYYYIFNEDGYIDIGNQGDIDVELLIIGGGGAGGNGNKYLDAYGGGGAGGEVIHIPSYKMKKGTRYEMSVSSDGGITNPTGNQKQNGEKTEITERITIEGSGTENFYQNIPIFTARGGGAGHGFSYPSKEKTYATTINTDTYDSTGITIDEVNNILYYTDQTNHTIMKYNLNTESHTLFAGTRDTAGTSRTKTSLQYTSPKGILYRSGHLYIISGHSVRKSIIDHSVDDLMFLADQANSGRTPDTLGSGGTITDIATARFDTPNDIVYEDGVTYVCCLGTIDSTKKGIFSYDGTDVKLINTSIVNPFSIDIASSANLIVIDSNDNSIKTISKDYSSPTVTTLNFSTSELDISSRKFTCIRTSKVIPERYYVIDAYHNRILVIYLEIISVYYEDGNLNFDNSRLTGMYVMPDDTLYVASNNGILKITPAMAKLGAYDSQYNTNTGGAMTYTLFTNQFIYTSFVSHYPKSGSGYQGQSSINSISSSKVIGTPYGITVSNDQQYMFITSFNLSGIYVLHIDDINNISKDTTIYYRLCGGTDDALGENGYQDGPVGVNKFTQPEYIVVDNKGEYLYFTSSHDESVKRVTISNGNVTSFIGRNNSSTDISNNKFFVEAHLEIPSIIQIDSQDNYIYVLDYGVRINVVNIATGERNILFHDAATTTDLLSTLNSGFINSFAISSNSQYIFMLLNKSNFKKLYRGNLNLYNTDVNGGTDASSVFNREYKLNIIGTGSTIDNSGQFYHDLSTELTDDLLIHETKSIVLSANNDKMYIPDTGKLVEVVIGSTTVTSSVVVSGAPWGKICGMTLSGKYLFLTDRDNNYVYQINTLSWNYSVILGDGTLSLPNNDYTLIHSPNRSGNGAGATADGSVTDNGFTTNFIGNVYQFGKGGIGAYSSYVPTPIPSGSISQYGHGGDGGNENGNASDGGQGAVIVKFYSGDFSLNYKAIRNPPEVTKALHVNSQGNVGIGTTNPYNRFSIYDNTPTNSGKGVESGISIYSKEQNPFLFITAETLNQIPSIALSAGRSGYQDSEITNNQTKIAFMSYYASQDKLVFEKTDVVEGESYAPKMSIDMKNGGIDTSTIKTRDIEATGNIVIKYNEDELNLNSKSFDSTFELILSNGKKITISNFKFYIMFAVFDGTVIIPYQNNTISNINFLDDTNTNSMTIYNLIALGYNGGNVNTTITINRGSSVQTTYKIEPTLQTTIYFIFQRCNSFNNTITRNVGTYTYYNIPNEIFIFSLSKEILVYKFSINFTLSKTNIEGFVVYGSDTLFSSPTDGNLIYTDNIIHNSSGTHDIILSSVQSYNFYMIIIDKYILKLEGTYIRVGYSDYKYIVKTSLDFKVNHIKVGYTYDFIRVPSTFTGQHLCKTIYENDLLIPGKIVESSGKYQNVNSTYHSSLINKNIDIEQALPNVNLTSLVKSAKVFGVISSFENKNAMVRINSLNNINRYPILSGDHRVIVNSIGEGAIWVSNYNGVLENGDYITSSAIPGIGMKQDEPYLANFTVAKITMDCDFNPNMVLLQKAKQEYVQRDDNYILDNVLDENCNIIYEQVLDTSNNPIYEPEYLVQYMRLDGTVIDRATYDVELSSNLAVYVCAFVGCTYHCG